MADVLIRSSDTQEQYCIDESKFTTPALYIPLGGGLESYEGGNFEIICYYPSNMPYP